MKKSVKKNAKGVTHNLKDTASGNRVVHEIKTKGCHVVVGGVVENIQVCPEGNETLPKTQRKVLDEILGKEYIDTLIKEFQSAK